jgi:hypothetical protein
MAAELMLINHGREKEHEDPSHGSLLPSGRTLSSFRYADCLSFAYQHSSGLQPELVTHLWR